MIVRITIIVFLLIAAASVSLLYYFYPASVNPYPGCMMHQLTGLTCPACGSQRSFSALLEGNLVQAMKHNVLFPVFLLLATFQFFLYIRHACQNRQETFRIRFTALQLWGMLALILLYFIVRNLNF